MRRIALSLALMCMLGFAGCSLCAPGYLEDYAGVGGKWQRSDPIQGRVGSVFSDPGATIQSNSGHDSMASESESYEPLQDEIYGDDASSDSGPYEGSIYDSPSYEDGVIILGEEGW